MESSWSRRRKKIISLSIFAIILIGGIFVAYKFFYVSPTCSDGIQNQNERGIDCGGKCEKLCADDFMSPQVTWTRFEEVAPGIFNVAAYITNPNIDGEAKKVPYKLVLYDNEGLSIKELTGTTNIPPNRNTIAFAGAVNTGKRTPTKAYFEFTAMPDWIKKSDTLGQIQIVSKDYVEEDGASSLLVTLRNKSFEPMGAMTVFAILYDKEGNARGFSKTFVDGIAAQDDFLAPFTWPIERNGEIVRIDVLPVAE